MNRRSFFSFLAAAPIAVPAIVVAATKPAYAIGGIVQPRQTFMFGVNSTEAVIPLPGGRIPVYFRPGYSVREFELIEIDPDQDYTVVAATGNTPAQTPRRNSG